MGSPVCSDPVRLFVLCCIFRHMCSMEEASRCLASLVSVTKAAHAGARADLGRGLNSQPGSIHQLSFSLLDRHATVEKAFCLVPSHRESCQTPKARNP